MEQSDNEVLVEHRGALGHIILNRPRAINALTHGMVKTIAHALHEWERDGAVETVLLTGAGERGLCAGGDIVGIYHDALAGGNATKHFWRDEYHLNAQIANYSKPLVVFMDGIVLGGGIGISAHASLRVVTERTRFGMPEVGIGFAPDVGGTWLLTRVPGEIGTHLGLTGGMGSGADAIALGCADYYVPADWLPALTTALENTPAAHAIATVATVAPAPALFSQQRWIDECYAGDDASAIVDRLLRSKVPEARAVAAVILTKSPTGISVTLEALRRSRVASSLEEVLNQDYRVSTRFLDGTELKEGIRAQVIDKDRAPQWSPPTLGEIDRSEIEAYFAPREAGELGLSAPARQE
ncbi:MAG: enoyl-CoA hydratase/isomerase family protein [Terrimesophilobacter sp.]